VHTCTMCAQTLCGHVKEIIALHDKFNRANKLRGKPERYRPIITIKIDKEWWRAKIQGKKQTIGLKEDPQKEIQKLKQCLTNYLTPRYRKAITRKHREQIQKEEIKEEKKGKTTAVKYVVELETKIIEITFMKIRDRENIIEIKIAPYIMNDINYREIPKLTVEKRENAVDRDNS